MKIIRLLFLTFFFGTSFFSIEAQDLPPQPKSYLNDFTHVFDTSQNRKLEQLLVDFQRQTGFELSVVTIASLQDYDISMFSYALAEKWGIGKKKKNNGVLLLFAPNERKINISTGYGVEGTLTDAMSKRIISKIAVPEFKKSNYREGIVLSVKAIIKVLDGSYAPGDFTKKRSRKRAPLPFVGIIFIIFFGIIFSLRNRRGRTYSSTRHGGMPWIFPSSGGFGSGGGGFGGGGFGGGSFGGGGASGGW